MRQRFGIIVGRPLFPHHLVERGNTHPKARCGVLTLAVVVELRQRGEAIYFFSFDLAALLGIGFVAAFLERGLSIMSLLGRGAHRSSSAATRSSAAPNGPQAEPSRRITSSGTPYCKATLATTALSRAAVSLSDPAFPLEMKISASSPSANLPTD